MAEVKKRRPAAMTANHRLKRVPVMRSDPKRQREKQDRDQRKQVIAALNRAARYWTPARQLNLSREDSRRVTTFLHRVQDAQKRFAAQPDKTDTGFAVLLPFETTRMHFREVWGIGQVSHFLALPIEQVHAMMNRDYPLPGYVARLHPDYKE